MNLVLSFSGSGHATVHKLGDRGDRHAYRPADVDHAEFTFGDEFVNSGTSNTEGLRSLSHCQ